MTNLIELITDGACSGNPGRGSYAALLRYNQHEKEIVGIEEETTNNRMELMAAIKGLEALKKPSHVKIITDSQYLQKGMEEWLSGWIARGWRTASKGIVKNQDLWQRLHELNQLHTLTWQWVKGHDGHPDNERVDKLARDLLKINKS
jgi:ribonuclease HI